MKTFGLGRSVETLGLGVPYGIQAPAAGKSSLSRQLYYENLYKIRRKKEEKEILLFLKTILTKGLI